MRTPLVMGNWKMHGTQQSARALLEAILAAGSVHGVQCAVCPPAVHIALVGEALQGSAVQLGAQDCAASSADGAQTGEISAAMLADLSCHYVLAGHSERRTLFGDSDDTVASKVEEILTQGMQPVLCLGETLEQRKADQTLAVVGTQLAAVTKRLSKESLAKMVFAYEPVWAIGTGETASPAQAQEVHAALRGELAELSTALAEHAQILYGGSVKPGNAAELFGQKDIDGGLIGGAALKAEDFLAICKAAA